MIRGKEDRGGESGRKCLLQFLRMRRLLLWLQRNVDSDARQKKKKGNSGPDANHATTTSRTGCSQSLGMTTESVVKTKCNPGPKDTQRVHRYPVPLFFCFSTRVLSPKDLRARDGKGEEEGQKNYC